MPARLPAAKTKGPRCLFRARGCTRGGGANRRVLASHRRKPRGAPVTLDVLGHAVHVPQACANVARFAFDDLCRLPLGPADFLALARRFHTVVVDAIPVIGADQRDEAKRFITLIDTFYDMHVKLLASAEAEPADLYLGTGGFVAFEFKRTVSRLIEMRSMEYLALPQGAVTSVGSGNTSGLVET